MALTIGDNFKYQANKPNFERDSFATLEAMKAYPETSIDDGHLSYCAETNKHYKFLSSNTVDETTGKWREFETGASISEDGVTGQVLTKTDNGYEWQDPQGSQEPQETRIVLDEFSERKFFDEFSKVTGAPAIGWAGALFIDDFSSSEYRDFYCCMTYGQGIVIRHTYATGTYEYLNSFIADSSTTSSSYNLTNKMNSGGWGNYYNGSELPLVYISRCSSDSSYIHTYYAYKINRSVTPFKFEKVLTIKYTGSKLAAITSDITIDAEKKHLYVHGYKSGSANAITGTSIVMVFNLPEPGSSNTITLADSDILWEFEFFVNEAAQDLCVSGGRLYYPYGSKSVHGIAVVDTKTGEILQNLDLANISTNFISNPEPEGVALSNGNLYLNYHHADTNSNEVCLVEFALQGVKESLKVPTSQSEDSVDIPNATQSTAGLMSAEDKAKLDGVSNNANNYTHPAGSAVSKSLGLYKISTDSTSHVQSVSPVTKSDITSLGIPAQDTTYNNATSTASGLMSASDKEKLDSINIDGETINVVADARALKGATMRFSDFVSGVTITQTGVNEWDGIVYDTAINKFLAKKGTLSPTYHNIWTGMNAYMSDELGTDILKDKLYLYREDIYAWSDTEGTLVKVDKEISNATQSTAGLMSSEDKTKLDNAFSRKALQKAELTDLSSDDNWFAPSVNADGNLQIKKKCGLAYTAICKVDTTALETGKAYKTVVIYKSPDSSFILCNGGQPLLQIEFPRSEDWNQIEFDFLNFYNYIEFQGLANVFPQGSIVTFKSIEFYSYGRVSADLLDLADEVDTIKNDINDEDWHDITPLCTARRYENVTVGSALPSAINGGGYLCAELDVKEGERYKLTTYSSRDKYPLIFVDKDNIVIKYVASYQSSSAITEYDGTGFEFSIPKDCVKIIIHYDHRNTGVTFKLMKASRFYVESINNKYKDANKYLWERSYPFSELDNYKSVLCGEIGTLIKEGSSKTNCTDIIPCSEGDVFHIRTYCNQLAIYMFFDENNRCIGGEGNIKVLPTPPKLFDDYVVAPKNATKLVVNGRSQATNQNNDEDSITDIFVIKCVKKNEPIILRNTEAIGAITAATKKFVKNNRLIKQWDGYFCIAHISDVHADPVRYRRFRTFVDNVYSINTAICTGDLVSFHNNDAKKMQIEHERMFSIGGEKDVMIVVGNHEKTGSGDVLYTEQQIKDYSGLENLYYYKDWTNETRDLAYKVRVIVLNQYDYDGTDIDIANRTHYSQAQINWFINTLKEASNDDRAVMVAMHKTDKFVQPTNNDYGFNCNFPSDLDTNQSGYIIEDIIDAFKNGTHLTESYTWTDNSQTIDVDADFSGKKGSFIAYMCGHNHRDQVGYSPQHPNQLYLCIAAGCLQQMYAIYGQGNYGEQVCDLSRVIGTKSEDCFNVYGIDFDNKTVRIVRVGADVTCNMKSRKYLELPWSPS